MYLNIETGAPAKMLEEIHIDSNVRNVFIGMLRGLNELINRVNMLVLPLLE